MSEVVSQSIKDSTITLKNLACSRRSDSRARRSVWSELNCTLGNRGDGGGREGDSEGTPVNILTKGRSGILDSSIPSYQSIMTPSVNTRALMTLKVTFHTSLWVVSRLSTLCVTIQSNCSSCHSYRVGGQLRAERAL